jgi:hypothetical protein
LRQIKKWMKQAKPARKTMSHDNMRVGKNYFIRNHGETTRFLVLETEGSNDFRIKDLLTLDLYLFGDLIRYGIGADFELYEL